MQKTIGRSLLFLATFLLLSGQVTRMCHTLAAPEMQSECVQQIIGNTEIMAIEEVNLDQDDFPDWIALYVNVNQNNDVYILAVRQLSEGCEVVLNEYLVWSTLTTGPQTVDVRAIEMIELTGDDKPELHIWLEKKGGGGGPRDNVAFHAIYTSVDGTWKHILGNVGITQCLAFSSFEFREAPTGNAKDIYLDEDVHCEPPWSSERTYTIMRWNGSRFMPAESGTIDKRTTDPPWANLCCVGTLLGPVAFVVLAMVMVITIALMTTRFARR